MTNELYHFGRLGMKWYKHIFGDKDKRAKYYLKGDINDRIDPDKKQEFREEREKEAKELADRQGVYYLTRDSFTLPKGSIVKRVTTVENEKNEGKTYVATLSEDAYKYIANAGLLTDYTTDPKYQVDLKVTKDLLVPSMDHVMDMVFSRIKDKPISEIVEQKEHEYGDTTNAYIKAFSNLDIKECRELAMFKAFIYIAKDPDRSKELFDSLKKEGYKAVIDYEDASGFSERPVIVFDRKDLKQVSSRKLSEEEIEEASSYQPPSNKYKKEYMEKHGERFKSL